MYSITAADCCYAVQCTHACDTTLQLSGCDYDEKTDIYSLGIMLFEMSHPSFRTAMERTIVSDQPLLRHSIYSKTTCTIATRSCG
jgi:serine/threonine protein kinase